jgi:hypothetical protein
MKSLVWKNGLDASAPFVVVVPAAMMDGDGFSYEVSGNFRRGFSTRKLIVS